MYMYCMHTLSYAQQFENNIVFAVNAVISVGNTF
jgi:hypothetical protein